MALHLPIGPLKTVLGWRRYRNANPVPTSPLSYDITTAPSGPITSIFFLILFMQWLCHRLRGGR